MKMSIKQYYDTLKAKRESAERELLIIKDSLESGKIDVVTAKQKQDETFKVIDTYTDCICLLESSHLLDIDPEDEKQNKAAAY